MLTAISRLWAWIGSIVRRRHFVSSVATVGYVPPPVPPVVLGALTFSATSFTVGGATSGTIIGATALSTVTASGLPSGLTINGALRTWTWSGTGTASTGTFTLTETLAGASNTPRASVISYTINAAGTTPTINSFTLTGIKRQGSADWLAIADDGTANKYKFDIQVAGVSLTGVTIRDGATSTVTSFPYVTTSPEISFDVPASLVDVAYTINGNASSDAGATWSAAKAVDEFTTFFSTFFTPATIATPTLTRNSSSGTIPMVYTISGVTLHDSDQIRQRRYTGSGTFVEENFVPISENGLATISLDASSASDPAPYPAPLGTLSTTDVIHVTIVSADYVQDGSTVVSGVTSSEATVSPSDVIPAMTWSTTDNYSDGSANTFSGGNMTMTNNGRASVRTNRVVAFDHTYVEMVGTDYLIAVADSSADMAAALTGFWGSASDGGVATTHAGSYYNNNGGQITYNGAPRGDVGTRGSTAVGQIALDRVNKKVWFGVDNTWKNGVPFVSGGLSIPGLSNFYFAAQGNSGQAITLNAGTTPGGTAGFTYTPPSDAVAP